MVVASTMGVFWGGVSVKTLGPTGPTAGLMYTGILMITAAGYSIQAYWFVLMISAVIIFILSYFPVEKLLNHIPYVSIAVFVNGMSFFILHKQLLKVIVIPASIIEETLNNAIASEKQGLYVREKSIKDKSTYGDIISIAEQWMPDFLANSGLTEKQKSFFNS